MEHIQDFTTRQYMVTPNFELFHYKDKSTLEVEYHNHDFYEIYFFESGNVTYLIEGKTYTMRPGDIIIINNRDLHRPIIDPRDIYERIVIWVNPEYLKAKSQERSDLTMCFENTTIKKYNLIRPSIEMSNKLHMVLKLFEGACSSFSYGNDILKDIYLLELVVHLNKAMLENDEDELGIDIKDNEKINSIIRHINSNLSGNLSLDYLASIFFVSKYHLSREFKKYTGYTIHKYIQQKRLIESKALIRQGLSVVDVCQLCGFDDYSNFIRCFKNKFGLPPKKYSQQNPI